MAGGRLAVDREHLHVSLGEPSLFSADIPVTSIRRVERAPDLESPTRGVHGHGGKWLVNRSGQDLVRVTIAPPAHARLAPPRTVRIGGVTGKILGFLTRERTIKLEELTVSVSNPDRLLELLPLH